MRVKTMSSDYAPVETMDLISRIEMTEREIKFCDTKQHALLAQLGIKEAELGKVPWWLEQSLRDELNGIVDLLNKWRYLEYVARDELDIMKQELQAQQMAEQQQATIEKQRKERQAEAEAAKLKQRQLDELAVAMKNQQLAELEAERMNQLQQQQDLREREELFKKDQIFWAVSTLFVSGPSNNGHNRFLEGIGNLFEEEEIEADRFLEGIGNLFEEEQFTELEADRFLEGFSNLFEQEQITESEADLVSEVAKQTMYVFDKMPEIVINDDLMLHSKEGFSGAQLDEMPMPKILGNSEEKEKAAFSITNCVKCLESMDGVDGRTYIKAINMFKDVDWREMFMAMSAPRRLVWLDSLEYK